MGTQILIGDVREKLRELADESVHCVVTSPPYWGLRDYGVDGQIGLEDTMQEHIALLVDVFREVRRVLRSDGTCWVNYGDAYSGSGKGGNPGDSPHIKQKSNAGSLTVRGIRRDSLKPKDRMLLPARLAIALCDDGWWLRDEIIWHKPNPMPSSVKDRTTPAHEMLYLLTKSARYHWDFDAMQEPASGTAHARRAQKMPDGWDTDAGAHGSFHRKGREKGKTNKQQETADASNPNTARTMGGFNERWNEKERKMAAAGSGIKYNESFDAAISSEVLLKRNRRSVWTVAPHAFPEAHFATFPPDLIRPCILAGCPAGGTVLDPFFGSGTTGLVAAEHGRNCIGIELNPEYVQIARRRLGLDRPRFQIDMDAVRREAELLPLGAALQARLARRV